MIVEKLDPHSGAILFKKDQESLDLEKAIKKIQELEERIQKVEEELKEYRK